MRSNREFRITLPAEMADLVDQKIASGEYATADDLFQDALRALPLQEQDANLPDESTLHAWLETEVLPSYDALQTDPSRGLSPQEVNARLAAARQSGANRRP